MKILICSLFCAAAAHTQTSAVLTNVNGGTFTGTPTYSVTESTVQVFVMPNLTDNIGSQTLTTTDATSGQMMQWIYVQDGTGNHTVSHPGTLHGACTVDPAPGAQTIITAVWDGSNALATGCDTNVDRLKFSGPEGSAPGTPASSTASCWADSTDHSGLECKANGSASVFKLVLSGVDINTVTGQVTNGSHITNGSIPNSGLVNASVTVNGSTCTLGSSCGSAPVNAPADLWLMNEGAGNYFIDLSGLANTAVTGAQLPGAPALAHATSAPASMAPSTRSARTTPGSILVPVASTPCRFGRRLMRLVAPTTL